MLRPSRSRRMLPELVSSSLAAVVVKVPITAAAVFGTSIASSPFAALVVCGAVFRLITWPLSLAGDVALGKVANALPEIQASYRNYLTIAEHPRAILWEKKLAAKKHAADRARIFRTYRTGNVMMVAPHSCAAFLTTAFVLGRPGELSSDFICSATASSGAASMSTGEVLLSPLTLYGAVDPSLSVCAALTLLNCRAHMQRRRGFNDPLDERIMTASYGMGLLWLLATVASLGLGSSALVAPHVVPLWLGVAIAGALKELAVRWRPFRFLVGIPDYPASHGSYGALVTVLGHEYNLAAVGAEAEENRALWEKSKKVLDFDCDGRIHRMFRKIGMYTEMDEFEHERELNRQRLATVMERRKESAATIKAQNVGYIHDVQTVAALELANLEENDRIHRKLHGVAGNSDDAAQQRDSPPPEVVVGGERTNLPSRGKTPL